MHGRCLTRTCILLGPSSLCMHASSICVHHGPIQSSFPVLIPSPSPSPFLPSSLSSPCALSPLHAVVLALSLTPRCRRRGSPHPVRGAAAFPGTAPWCAVQRRCPRPRPSPCSPPALPRPAGPRVVDETLPASSSPSAAATTKLGAWIWWYLTLFLSYPDAGRR